MPGTLLLIIYILYLHVFLRRVYETVKDHKIDNEP